jgi:MFS family permease
MEHAAIDKNQETPANVAANQADRPADKHINHAAVSLGVSGPETPFSVFTSGQKRWISWMASFGAMFSTLNSFIYFPAIVPMARDLNVSVTLINLTITCYLLVAGLAPAFMGDLADHDGRRPVYLLMFVLMLGANIGLAVQDSYPVLFALRMIQSAGSSGTFGAANGVISDVAPVSERGSYTGTLIFL